MQWRVAAEVSVRCLCYDWAIVLFSKLRSFYFILGLLVIMGTAALFHILVPGEPGEYTWNQKVTLTIETKDGVFSSSAVQKVTWYKNSAHAFNPASQEWLAKIQGEMPFVLLADGRTIFSLYSKNGDESLMARHLLHGRADDPNVLRSMLEDVSDSVDNIVSLDASHMNFPVLVEFADLEEPSSISRYLDGNLYFSIELTVHDFTVGNVEKKIPWLDSIPRTKGVGMPASFALFDDRPGVGTATKSEFVRE